MLADRLLTKGFIPMFLKAKKLLPIFLAAVIMLSVVSMGFYANAAALPVFTVSDVFQARPGDIVSVTVDVDENRGYCAGEFVLRYDPAVLTPIDVQAGEAASEYFAANKDYDSGEVFFAHISETLMPQAGTVATISFGVNEGVILYSGDLELKVNALVGDITVGQGLNDIKNTVNSGEIHAARKLTVPSGSVYEQLSLKNTNHGLLVSGLSVDNISADSIAENFFSITARAFSQAGGSLRAEQWLTTGCKVQLFDGNEMVNDFTVVVKADVNGDYHLDGEDAFLANLVAQGAASKSDLGYDRSEAADVNGDGVIDQTDIDALADNGLSMP